MEWVFDLDAVRDPTQGKSPHKLCKGPTIVIDTTCVIKLFVVDRFPIRGKSPTSCSRDVALPVSCATLTLNPDAMIGGGALGDQEWMPNRLPMQINIDAVATRRHNVS